MEIAFISNACDGRRAPPPGKPRPHRQFLPGQRAQSPQSRTLPARLARAAIAAELAGGGALERDRF